jgi:phosphoglucomutase
VAAISPLAGKPAPQSLLVDLARLEREYYERHPDLGDPTQLVSFGTSGHRGSPLNGSFTSVHIAAITQAICDYRRSQSIDGPLYMGKDTHAVSGPAQRTALEVLAANSVETIIQRDGGVTPTPVISWAILGYNRGRKTHLADGIVVTPSHNPPEDGGFKYNPPNGGPADLEVTDWVQNRANELLRAGSAGVKRVPFASAIKAARDLLAAHQLGLPAQHHRREPGDRPDILVHDRGSRRQDSHGPLEPVRHGAACRSQGPVRRRLRERPGFRSARHRHPLGRADEPQSLPGGSHTLPAHPPATVGQPRDSRQDAGQQQHDRSRRREARPPADGGAGGLQMVRAGTRRRLVLLWGEESAGASFLRHDGTVWTTDKDGPIMDLLAAEITARTGKDPGEHYQELTEEFGAPCYTRIDAAATPDQKARLAKLSAEVVKASTLAGEPITEKLTRAPGNHAPIGGLKVVATSGWFAARPSGTENIYKIYAESFRSESHLEAIVSEAQGMVNTALGADR